MCFFTNSKKLPHWRALFFFFFFFWVSCLPLSSPALFYAAVVAPQYNEFPKSQGHKCGYCYKLTNGCFTPGFRESCLYGDLMSIRNLSSWFHHQGKLFNLFTTFELPCTTQSRSHTLLRNREKRQHSGNFDLANTSVLSNGGYEINLLLFRVRSVHWAMFLPRQSCGGSLSLVRLRGSCINMQKG